MNKPTCELCGDLVANFHFEELANAHPPKKAGVYAIRVVERGMPPSEIVSAANSFLSNLPWPQLTGWVASQMALVGNIKDCSLIYLGMTAKRTIQDRYKELAWSHPTTFALAALLYFGWKLEYGWTEAADPVGFEKEKKKKYSEMHGRLPALMYK
jgi:hypothetical protein